MSRPEGERMLEAAYGRLDALGTLGGSLVSETDPAKTRETLGKIIGGGEISLEQTGSSANPCLLSHTHMTIAAAQVDLANVENDEATRTELIRAGTKHCEDAMAASLASGITCLRIEVTAWFMAVLARALRTAQGEECLVIKQRVDKCAEDIDGLFEKQLEDQRTGLQRLFESQIILTFSDSADPSHRTIMLEHAMQLAREAFRRLVSAGNFEAVGHARENLARIKTALGDRTPAVSANAYVPAAHLPEQVPRGLKLGKGGRIRNFILTFAAGTVISLTLPLLLGMTNPFLLSGIGFVVTFFVGRLVVRKGKTTTTWQPTVQASTVTSAPAGPPPIAAGDKFCVSCGSKIPVSDGFCERCGAKQP